MFRRRIGVVVVVVVVVFVVVAAAAATADDPGEHAKKLFSHEKNISLLDDNKG
jgi:hypothetical protein